MSNRHRDVTHQSPRNAEIRRHEAPSTTVFSSATIRLALALDGGKTKDGEEGRVLQLLLLLLLLLGLPNLDQASRAVIEVLLRPRKLDICRRVGMLACCFCCSLFLSLSR
jgi:hypothetical protein